MNVFRIIRSTHLFAGVLGALVGGAAAAGEPEPEPAHDSRPALAARPCLIGAERCVDLSRMPFEVCLTTRRCERGAVVEPLVRRTAVYHRDS
jgi:hypothetical protein